MTVKELERVCVVVQNYFQVDPRVYRKVKALAETGYTVDVIALQEERKVGASGLDNVDVYEVPLKKRRGGKLRYLYEYGGFWIATFFLVTYLHLRHPYQVVDVNTLPDFLVFAALIPKLFGARLVLDMHEVMPEFYMSKFAVDADHRLVRFIRWLEGRSVRFSDAVIACNHLVAEVLIRRGAPASKVTVIMNSADEEFFHVGAHKSLETEMERDWENSPLILMYHGTITRIYGLDIAIRALRTARQWRPDLDMELHILGAGSSLEKLHALVRALDMEGRVRFLGKVPFSEVPQYIARCDVGLLPTRADVFLNLSFSNKLVEYVVMHKPVISARLPGYTHYFREASLAFFEPENVTALAETMIWMATHRENWDEMVENARVDARQIQWTVMRRRYLELVAHT